jgi:hypothetical protein
MNRDEHQFEELSVRLLFKRIRDGRYKVSQQGAPRLVAAISAVRFKSSGEPIFETVNEDVRRAARFLANSELNSPRKHKADQVRDVMPKRIDVTAEQLAGFGTRGQFSELTFQLFKETGCMAVIASSVSVANERSEHPFERDQAICAGLLIRIFKLIMAVCRLVSTGDGAEVNLQLLRSMFESATNLRFLLHKNDKKLFDLFVSSSLGPERELYDLVQATSKERGGELLPIEHRILDQIQEACDRSGIKIEAVPRKHQAWGGSLRDKLEYLKEEHRYALGQRFPSHSVHGDWIDLVTFHLKHEGDRFGVQQLFWPNTPAVYLLASVFVLEAIEAYLRFYFEPIREIETVFERIDDLQLRLEMVDDHYEKWVQRNPPSEDYPS